MCIIVSKMSGVSVKTLSGSKKGQGLSLNTIIIAIIVLIVLVVLVMIFTGYFGRIFTPSVRSCSAQGGQCASQCNSGQLGNEVSGADCPDKTLKCCASVQTQFNQRQEGVASCQTQTTGADCYGANTLDCTADTPGVTKAACCSASPPCPSATPPGTYSVTSCAAWGKTSSTGPCNNPSDKCCK